MNLAVDMSAKSDNLIFMEIKYLTATEVARNFSAVLDEVENGQEIIVLRGKTAVAKLVSAAPKKPNGAKILEIYRRAHERGDLGPNEDFDKAMQEILDRRDELRVDRINPWEQ